MGNRRCRDDASKSALFPTLYSLFNQATDECEPQTTGAGRSPRSGIRRGARDDSRRHRCVGCRAPRAVSGGGPPRRHGLDGDHGGASPASLQHVAPDALHRHARHELCTQDRPAGRAEPARPRRHLLLRPVQRLPRRREIGPQARRRRAGAGKRGGGQGIRRHGTADGKAARRGSGPRLAGQAHQPRVARLRLVAVPGCRS